MRLRSFPTAALLVLLVSPVSGGAVDAQTAESNPATAVDPAVAAPTAAPAEATTSTIPANREVVITGRGFGHGRGLGQWGAFGYAKNLGWNYRQILDHFYGGTTAGAVSPASAIGVRVSALDGRAVTFFQPKGRVYTAAEGQAGFTFPPALAAAQSPVAGLEVIAAVTVPSGTVPPPTVPPLLTGGPAAVRIEAVAGGFLISDSASCDGPFSPRPVAVTPSITVSAGPADPSVSADDPGEMLSVCEPKGVRHVYRGDFLAVDAKPGQRTVNLVGLDAYLRGVVPREIAASWGDKALEAVKAQAVAARSYAAAERRSGFANTCDSTSCQVYGGRGRYVNGQFVSLEDPRTDRAIAETANEIRINPKTGVPIRTEFSASTGGFTAPGAFPAVPDEGDATLENPNHGWTLKLAAGRFERGRNLGSLIAARVVSRDGFGDGGGRVAKLELRFTGGSASMTGDELMRAFSLRSSWFDLSVVAVNGAATESTTAEASTPALTGDASGVVVAAAALPDTAPASVPATTEATAATKPRRPKVVALPASTIAVVVAAGSDPVKTVVGGVVVGSPTTVPATKKKR